MRKRFYVIYTLVLVIAIVLNVVEYMKPTENVIGTGEYKCIILDGEDLLTSAEEEKLTEEIQPILRYGNVIFSTVMTEDYEKNSEDTYYNYYGNEPGVNFQIDMQNRKITISASNGMHKLIGNKTSSIVDNSYKYATNGDYYKCASEVFNEIIRLLNGKRIAQKMKYISNGVLAVTLALILNFVAIFSSELSTKKKVLISGGTALLVDTSRTKIKKGSLKKTYSPKSSGESGGNSHGGSGFSGSSSSHGF